MRHPLSFLLALVTLAAAVLAGRLAFAQQDAADPTPSPTAVIAEIDWLAGSWAGDMWGGRFEAYYSTPTGGKVLSHSRLMSNGKQSFYEFEVIEARGADVHLQPYPGGKPAGGFLLAEHDAAQHKAVFENPDKDFPTRITYQRVSDDELVIVLSNIAGETAEDERFELRRTAPSDE